MGYTLWDGAGIDGLSFLTADTGALRRSYDGVLRLADIELPIGDSYMSQVQE
ncbi:hypothetical protein [Chitinophaga niabensis]|uniref:hypothetical protein n=1 Tax=Chitinophaga niabensis TaxID=536979 RepID=UPI00135667C6|nr:hypothetical protein [Chitinophaga niabensis]